MGKLELNFLKFYFGSIPSTEYFLLTTLLIARLLNRSSGRPNISSRRKECILRSARQLKHLLLIWHSPFATKKSA